MEIDGFKTESIADMFTALEDNKPGETIDVTVIRGRQRKTIEVEPFRALQGTVLELNMNSFKVKADFEPAGDQRQA